MTEFNIVGRFVTIGVDTLTEESAIIFQKLFNELINMGSISPVPRKYEAHMEMHNHHIFDELMTGDAIIRSAYGIPTHYHFILPINFFFSIIT